MSRRQPLRHQSSPPLWTTLRSKKAKGRTSSADWYPCPTQRWKSNGSTITSLSRLAPDLSRPTALVSSLWILCTPILKTLALTPAERRTSSERRLRPRLLSFTVSTLDFSVVILIYCLFYDFITDPRKLSYLLQLFECHICDVKLENFSNSLESDIKVEMAWEERFKYRKFQYELNNRLMISLYGNGVWRNLKAK